MTPNVPTPASATASAAKSASRRRLKRWAESDSLTRSSISRASETACPRSSSRTRREMSASEACASTAARASTVIIEPKPKPDCRCGRYSVGRTGSLKAVCFTSPTTPTMVIHFVPGSSENRIRRPNGSSVPQYFNANDWLMIATGGCCASSCSANSLPFNTGMCSVRKYPGDTSRYSGSGRSPGPRGT